MAPALTNRMKACLGFLFNCSLVAPSVVVQWWTIWSLLDRLLGQEDKSNMSLEDLQKLAMKDPENMDLQEEVSQALQNLGSQVKNQLTSLAAGLMAKILLDILQPFLGGCLVNKSSLLQLAGQYIHPDPPAPPYAPPPDPTPASPALSPAPPPVFLLLLLLLLPLPLLLPPLLLLPLLPHPLLILQPLLFLSLLLLLFLLPLLLPLLPDQPQAWRCGACHCPQGFHLGLCIYIWNMKILYKRFKICDGVI